ncbi:MAG: peptide chain release factor N(5)-glutamine methyltransferase [Burkholderiales bacterium]
MPPWRKSSRLEPFPLSTSIAQLLARDAARIGQALCLAAEDAHSETQILLAHALGKSRAWVMAHGTDDASAVSLSRYSAWVARRVAGEPIAYILGEREFYGLRLKVCEHVLIPRPETELLVDTALSHIPKTRPCKLLDLGTGSGCIALAIAVHASECQVLGADASPKALSVAASNLQRHHVENVDLLHSDWYEALGTMRFDLIVSNPPYIAADDTHLAQGDLRFEPPMALTPGTNGLEAIERIVTGARGYLREGGWLMLEHGHDQAQAVRETLERNDFLDVAAVRDLVGIPRVSLGRAGPD